MGAGWRIAVCCLGLLTSAGLAADRFQPASGADPVERPTSQQLIHQRAAREAQLRQARIASRRVGGQTVARPVYNNDVLTAHPSLYRIDRGISPSFGGPWPPPSAPRR